MLAPAAESRAALHDSARDYLGLRQHAIKKVHGTAARHEVCLRSTGPRPRAAGPTVRLIKF